MDQEKEMSSISYSIREAARASGLGETTLRNLIRDGELPVSEIGAKRLVKREDLERLIDTHRRH